MNVNEMRVEVSGEGPPLVLVHGLGGTSNFWQPVLPVLCRRFMVYRPDLPGSGRSPKSDRSTTVAGFVSDLIALFDQAAIERVHLAGHSFGSLVVQHFASMHPDRVIRLALVGPVKAPSESGRVGARDRATKVRREGMAAVADAIVKAATAAVTREQKPVAAAFVRELLMRQDPEGYARTCEALAESTDPDLGRIASPTLLLPGREGAVGTPLMAERLNREIANSVVRVIEGCGHWTAIEQPEETARALDEFFR